MFQPTSVHTFHDVAPLKRVVPTIIIVSIVTPAVVSMTNPTTSFIVPFVAAVVLFIDVWLFVLAKHARLEVSAAGIAYIETGLSVHSTWENIQGSGVVSRGLFFKDEVLFLHKPGLETSSWIPSNRVSQLASTIPVGRFAVDWQNSELGVLIKQYAPQAFDNPI